MDLKLSFILNLIFPAPGYEIKVSMKKIAKKRAASLGNMFNIGRNKTSNMCQNAYLLCLQGIKMCRSTKQEFRKHMYEKEDTSVRE